MEEENFNKGQTSAGTGIAKYSLKARKNFCMGEKVRKRHGTYFWRVDKHIKYFINGKIKFGMAKGPCFGS